MDDQVHPSAEGLPLDLKRCEASRWWASFLSIEDSPNGSRTNPSQFQGDFIRPSQKDSSPSLLNLSTSVCPSEKDRFEPLPTGIVKYLPHPGQSSFDFTIIGLLPFLPPPWPQIYPRLYLPDDIRPCLTGIGAVLIKYPGFLLPDTGL